MLNRFQPAASSARSRSASVVSRMGSTAWIRNGSMIVCQRSMAASIRVAPDAARSLWFAARKRTKPVPPTPASISPGSYDLPVSFHE